MTLCHAEPCQPCSIQPMKKNLIRKKKLLSTWWQQKNELNDKGNNGNDNDTKENAQKINKN